MTVELELLRLIHAETVRVESLDPYRAPGTDSREWVARCEAMNALADGLGVRVSGNWLGDSPAARKRRQRALQALERAGLVELHASWSGGNVTHVKLTAAGRRAAGGTTGGKDCV